MTPGDVGLFEWEFLKVLNTSIIPKEPNLLLHVFHVNSGIKRKGRPLVHWGGVRPPVGNYISPLWLGLFETWGNMVWTITFVQSSHPFTFTNFFFFIFFVCYVLLFLLFSLTTLTLGFLLFFITKVIFVFGFPFWFYKYISLLVFFKDL